MGIEMEGEGQSLVAMNEEYELLKRKYAETQEQLKTLLFEKEHTDDNYRQYVENLKAELQQASLQVCFNFFFTIFLPTRLTRGGILA